MPYVFCPICHDFFHLKIHGDIAAWEQQHVIDRTKNGTPLLKCIRCWVELRVGHLVTIRTVPPTSTLLQVGQQGCVISTQLINNDMIITVRFGEQHYDFKRDELFYVMGQPSIN